MKEAGLSYSTCTLLMMKLIRKNNDYSQASERVGGGGGSAPPPIFFLQSYTNHKKNFLFFGPRISDKSTPAPLMTLTYNFIIFSISFLCFCASQETHHLYYLHIHADQKLKDLTS